MDFTNKTVLITGASAGIGEALARQLGAKAQTLVLIARRQAALNRLRQELITTYPKLNVLLFAKDISVAENQQAIKEELDKQGVSVDVLINNAGVGDEALFCESDAARLRNVIELNVVSVVNLTHVFIRDFVSSPAGKGIVFVGSGAGIAWMPGNAIYSASKHFITALAMNLRAELRPLGINVALVAPGPVDSEFDQHAGISKGMKGGPSQKTRISAVACAVDTVRLLEKNKSLVIPGRKMRLLMHLYLWFPWFLRQKMLEKEGETLLQHTSSPTLRQRPAGGGR